jgi:hypothetical protein
MPDWHSKDRGKVRADRHVKSVIEEIPKHWCVGLDPELFFANRRKKVDEKNTGEFIYFSTSFPEEGRRKKEKDDALVRQSIISEMV